VKLYVAFPLLAAVLNSSNQVWRTLDSATLESLRSMVAYLAEFSISADYDARSRSAAAKCLFSVLFHSSQDDGCDGDIETLHTLLEEVHQVVTDAVTCLEKEATETITPQKSGNPKALEESMHASFSRIEDALSFMGLLVSHAPSRLIHAPSQSSLLSLLLMLFFTRAQRQLAREALSLEQQIILHPS